MDSLFSLFAMEASGIIDAEAMVKGMVPIAVYFSFMIFLRGSFAGQAWGIFSTSPLISQQSRPVLSHYRISGRERSSRVDSHPIMVQVICQPGQLCAPPFVHRPAGFRPSIVSPEHCLGSVSVDGSGLSRPASFAMTSLPMQ